MAAFRPRLSGRADGGRISAAPGLYRLSIRVYAGIDCGPSDCVPDDDGFNVDE